MIKMPPSVFTGTPLIYPILLLISFSVYFYLKNRIPRMLRNWFVDHSLFITLIILTLGLATADTNLKQLSFTFSSVYLGFWLGEQKGRQRDRRKLGFYLGLIWQELRFNIHQLENIKVNFNFYLDDPEFLKINFIKFSNVYSLSKLLKTSVYQSFISSGSVVTLTSDDIFNAMEIAYNDIKYLESSLEPVLLDYKTKMNINNLSISLASGLDSTPYIQQVTNDIKNKISASAKEIAITYRDVSNARDALDKHLNTLGIKFKEDVVDRESVLTDEDREFVARSLRETPKSLPENLFGT